MKKVFGLLVAGLLAGPMTANAFLINYQDSPTNNIVKSITGLAVDGKIYDVTFNNYYCFSFVNCEGFDETFAGDVQGAFNALTAIQNALNSAAPAPRIRGQLF